MYNPSRRSRLWAACGWAIAVSCISPVSGTCNKDINGKEHCTTNIPFRLVGIAIGIGGAAVFIMVFACIRRRSLLGAISRHLRPNNQTTSQPQQPQHILYDEPRFFFANHEPYQNGSLHPSSYYQSSNSLSSHAYTTNRPSEPERQTMPGRTRQIQYSISSPSMTHQPHSLTAVQNGTLTTLHQPVTPSQPILLVPPGQSSSSAPTQVSRATHLSSPEHAAPDPQMSGADDVPNDPPPSYSAVA